MPRRMLLILRQTGNKADNYLWNVLTWQWCWRRGGGLGVSTARQSVDTGAARYVVIEKHWAGTIRLLVATSHHYCLVMSHNHIISVTMFQTIIIPSAHIISQLKYFNFQEFRWMNYILRVTFLRQIGPSLLRSSNTEKYNIIWVRSKCEDCTTCCCDPSPPPALDCHYDCTACTPRPRLHSNGRRGLL